MVDLEDREGRETQNEFLFVNKQIKSKIMPKHSSRVPGKETWHCL
jgi:hypothetical protein